MQLNWIKCQGDVWCQLNTVNLNHAHFDAMYGVYIIWHGGANAATVYVGQGDIKDQLAQHKTDPRIQEYNHLELHVTWASVLQSYRNGVESYLAQTLRPKVGEVCPSNPPVPVNLPW